MHELLLSNYHFQILAAELAVTILAIGISIQIAHKINFVSNPNPIVKTHTAPVALGGGIVMLIIIFFTLWFFENQNENHSYINFLLIPVFIFGLIDDIFRVKPLLKLAGQIVIAFVYIALTSHQLMYVPLIVIFLIASQNAWNLLDIMDGLVASISLFCFISIAVINSYLYGSSPIAIVTAIALIGFLIWNKKPAKIYLGETGASLLGLLYSILVIEGFEQNYQTGLTLGLTGLIPFFELLFLIIVRTQKGIPFYRGSPDHFALRLLSKGYSVGKIVGFTGLISLLIMLAAVTILLTEFKTVVLLSVYLVFIGLSIWAYFYLKAIPGEEQKYDR